MSSPISGFTAIPNPIMLSFMGAQSFIMMYMAGEAWQYGKRKISAMTNEEFNKLTPVELLKQQQSTLKEAIPSMNQSMQDMKPMIQTVAKEMVAALPEIAKGLGAGVSEIINPTATQTSSGTLGFSAVGTTQIGIAASGAQSIAEVFAAVLAIIQGAGSFKPSAVTDIFKQEQKNKDIEQAIVKQQEQEIKKKQQTAKEIQLSKGQEGLKISQKVQLIPLTRAQRVVFVNYTSAVKQINKFKKLIPNSGKLEKYYKQQLVYWEKQRAKWDAKIRLAKSVNLVGFELYYKWLAQQ